MSQLCCAKNRCCESSCVASPLTSLQALVYHLKLFWTAILGYHDCVSELMAQQCFTSLGYTFKVTLVLSLHGLTLVQN